MPRYPCGLYTVAHVYPALYGFEQIVWSTYAHEISRFILRKKIDTVVHDFKHKVLRLPYRKTAYGVSGKIELYDLFSTLTTEVLEDSALHYPEQSLRLPVGPRLLASREPAHRSSHRVLYVFPLGRIWSALVERHHDVRAQVLLDLYRSFRSEHVPRSVDMALK